ncbi:MAG: serine/threonine-protein kinase [Polyangiaceae bacterium]
MDVTIGELIDKKYRIVRLLGEGGMGAVYEGENIRVHNRVAIKVLHANIATNQAAVDRFEREAQAAGRIGSEHICEVFDLGDLPSGARYMVMEYLDGESMSGRVTRLGRIPPVQLAQLMMQMLEGLGAAHRAGIIHRDLKPDNVFITKTKNGGDFVKLVDFGVSKFNQLSGDSAMSMTRTGAVIGTPYYMSPEQAKGSKDIDHRSDLYSAGVVMFECVTGQVPFLADTFNELMFKIVLEPVPGPETIVPDLDPAFANLVKKGMAREAKDRFQSADEFMQALAGWLAGQGVQTSMAARAPMASVPSTRLRRHRPSPTSRSTRRRRRPPCPTSSAAPRTRSPPRP